MRERERASAQEIKGDGARVLARSREREAREKESEKAREGQAREREGREKVER